MSGILFLFFDKRASVFFTFPHRMKPKRWPNFTRTRFCLRAHGYVTNQLCSSSVPLHQWPSAPLFSQLHAVIYKKKSFPLSLISSSFHDRCVFQSSRRPFPFTVSSCFIQSTWTKNECCNACCAFVTSQNHTFFLMCLFHCCFGFRNLFFFLNVIDAGALIINSKTPERNCSCILSTAVNFSITAGRCIWP